MKDLTVIYYTSNREDPKFENKIIDNILNNCDGLPIVSVSQKPMTFGNNIVVGDVGTSGFNCLRQMMLACEAAKTKFVIHTEADCLYPPDYFKFIPPDEDHCYRNDNTYLVGLGRDCFWRKHEAGTWAQVVSRKLLLDRLLFLFDGEDMWNTDKQNFPKEKGLSFFDRFKTFHSQPCISFKSGKGMRKYSHSDRVSVYELPYWGDSRKLCRFYLG